MLTSAATISIIQDISMIIHVWGNQSKFYEKVDETYKKLSADIQLNEMRLSALVCEINSLESEVKLCHEEAEN